MTSLGCDEPLVEKKKRAGKIVRALKKAYPEATCALNFRTPFELLVATILSAQCTDQRVNKVTPALFEKYPTPQALAQARQADLEQLIKSTGFFRAKANTLKEVSKALVKDHGGEVPQTLEELVKLPGVGRKTANVVLGTAFGIPSGIVVDTHVKRVSRLLGLTCQTNPDKIEQDLMQLIPQKEWIDFAHRLILHGRAVCVARRPRCEECPLLNLCPRVGLPPLDGRAPSAQPSQRSSKRTSKNRKKSD